ncbi:MAG: hypothetical protein KIS76_13940 [Pyrinomonadaceae bacterium]|nr:hypothetical protein [Pyrinomonadaceae bacterium]
MNSKLYSFKIALLIGMLSFSALVFNLQKVEAQNDPLTLAAVLTALQSTSSGMSLAQKNAFVIKRVNDRGVTFRLTPEIERELKTAGASVALINAIRLNSPRLSTPTPTPARNTSKVPAVTFEKLWVDYDVTEDDEKGMRVHVKFTVSNMLNVPGYVAVYFETKGGDPLTSSNPKYSVDGQLVAFRRIAPAYDPAVYSDYAVFIPYREFTLPYGDHNLRVDADLVTDKFVLIKHLDLYEFIFKNPKPVETVSDANVTFDKMWVDYNVKENGKLGMRVHAKINIQNMKGVASQFVVFFEKANGDKLYTDNASYRSKGGQTAVYIDLTPLYPSTDFTDIKAFIPYEEFNLPKGKHSLQVHSDLIYPDGTLIKHLNYYPFSFTQP